MICRRCGEPMTFNALIAGDADRALDPGLPRPMVLGCRHGHSERLDATPDPVGPPATYRTTPQCAVCGTEIPRQKGSAPRKSCGLEHKRFIERKRAEAQAAHVRQHRQWRSETPFVPFRFILEAQPWYRGAATAFQPPARRAEVLVPTWADFPEIPAAWLEGFRAVYPVLEEPAPVLPSTFPAIEDMHDDPGMGFRTRRYRRRKPKAEPTLEQLMPYPVPHA